MTRAAWAVGMLAGLIGCQGPGAGEGLASGGGAEARGETATSLSQALAVAPCPGLPVAEVLPSLQAATSETGGDPVAAGDTVMGGVDTGQVAALARAVASAGTAALPALAGLAPDLAARTLAAALFAGDPAFIPIATNVFEYEMPALSVTAIELGCEDGSCP